MGRMPPLLLVSFSPLVGLHPKKLHCAAFSIPQSQHVRYLNYVYMREELKYKAGWVSFINIHCFENLTVSFMCGLRCVCLQAVRTVAEHYLIQHELFSFCAALL